MHSAALKFGLGIVVLLASAIFWWDVENESTDRAKIPPSGIAWERFPVLLQGENSTDTLPANRAEEATVVFVYSPHQCYSNRDAMDSWHRVARQVEGVQAANVLLDRSRLSARRYLKVFSTPYQTRLDSTGWFRKTLDLKTTPAVVLLSEIGLERIVYPAQQRLSDADRQTYVSQLSSPTE